LCGSQLSYENAAYPAAIDVTTATLDNPNSFPPSAELWLDHRIEWQVANPDIEHCDRGNADAATLAYPE
jgi:hypothetical protein